jgi:predicted DNA-binding transcriptional regulator YafY
MKSFINRLSHLDHLIQFRRTGRPSACATKIGISERSLYDYLKLMKDMGAPVKFSRAKGTYYYDSSGNLKIGFVDQKGMPPSQSMESGNSVHLYS